MQSQNLRGQCFELLYEKFYRHRSSLFFWLIEKEGLFWSCWETQISSQFSKTKLTFIIFITQLVNWQFNEKTRSNEGVWKNTLSVLYNCTVKFLEMIRLWEQMNEWREKIKDLLRKSRTLRNILFKILSIVSLRRIRQNCLFCRLLDWKCPSMVYDKTL